jgi:hypothetical protein
MYATVERRTANQERLPETARIASGQFFPTLAKAPGLIGFYLIAGDDGVNTAIALWESRAHAEAFQPTADDWARTLEEHGHRLASDSGGEILFRITPHK